tara:strand:+ start:508 stop:1038 length:531 start_codon:yes stop_codon:yes gene_type:complete
MNRRDFIKAVPAVAALPAIVSAETNCKKDELAELADCEWHYRVFCYEREQGAWIFAKNTRGSFASEREYMTFEEEEKGKENPRYLPLTNGYAGFMYDGVLHFQTFDDATEFIEMHIRAKDDTNIVDTIYDIYYKNTFRKDAVEHQVAHYWFNGDTGSQIHWEQDGFNTDWNKVESA